MQDNIILTKISPNIPLYTLLKLFIYYRNYSIQYIIYLAINTYNKMYLYWNMPFISFP